MSAVILDFRTAMRRRTDRHRRATDAKPCAHDAVAQAVMEQFKSYPVSIVESAIQAAQINLTEGGGFVSAMDAAVRMVADLAKEADRDGEFAARNQQRLDMLDRNREKRANYLHGITEKMICAHLRGHPEPEIKNAIARARRVLLGGGSLCNAIYHATKIGTEST